MMLNVIIWYLVVAFAGWLAFPLARRLLAFLPDRGLIFARPLGLLVWGYFYWLLVSLRLLQNDAGGVIFALLLVAALSAWQLRGGGLRSLLDGLRKERRLVLASELVFLILFAFMAVVRAANPAAAGTEKPMELAFINAILRSPSFPPSDPWLSGYAISYYYFGYVIVAMLARMASVPGAVAFNLALASCFALAGLAAYGLVYNLLSLRDHRASGDARRPVILPLLAPLFLLIVSNLEGFLEMLHARGIFWQQTASGWQSRFWSWLNIQEVVNPPVEPFGWQPERLGGIWWWRASRVLQDFDWNNHSREIIDEFPAFSYLLGDLHPHVLAMPFVLLAAAFALNIFLKLSSASSTYFEGWSWLRRPDFWAAALVLGGLSFLNTWDFPIYLALFAAAAVLPRFLRSGLSWTLALEFAALLLFLGAAGIMLYLPFYTGFASQAGGILPSLIFFTRGAHFWVMFAPLLLPVFAWLIWSYLRQGGTILRGLLFAGGLVAGLWLLSSVYGWLRLVEDPAIASAHYGAVTGAPLVAESFLRRLASPGAWISLLALIALVWTLLARHEKTSTAPVDAGGPAEAVPPAFQYERLAESFALLLVLLGAGLALFPEFFYLRDQFGWRMNTIFKFYFQAWIVWSCAAAYASAVLLDRVKRPVPAAAWRVGLVALLTLALVYPYFGILDRTNNFQPERWTLDGADYLARFEPDEIEAIRWLQTAPYGVVAEAAKQGTSYSGYSRVSTLSGLPAVLGWPGHESQWRGGTTEMGSRDPDLNQLYTARTWDQARSVLEKYNIRYVFVGSLERSQYRANITLFERYMRVAFENDTVKIFEAPRYPNEIGQVP